MTAQWLAQEPPVSVAPVPTVVVEPQVTIPPELLETLTPPDPGWFTQPVATILASFIALGAAIIAWRGVKRQINAAAGNLARQIDAEAKKEDLALKRQALIDGIAALTEARQLLLSRRYLPRKTHDDWSVFVKQLDLNLQRRNEVSAQLIALHLQESRRLFGEVNTPLITAAGNYDSATQFDERLAVYDAAQEAAIDQLEADVANARNNLQSHPEATKRWTLSLPFGVEVVRAGRIRPKG
ncbi:hypothetical protein CH256_17435 [Rhodococcus sp. 05-2254-6]|nr:hypothetical protein CH256_17435 [Rhodococcus sp. 05-2254-6]